MGGANPSGHGGLMDNRGKSRSRRRTPEIEQSANTGRSRLTRPGLEPGGTFRKFKGWRVVSKEQTANTIGLRMVNGPQNQP
jgi:hypothetical protein